VYILEFDRLYRSFRCLDEGGAGRVRRLFSDSSCSVLRAASSGSDSNFRFLCSLHFLVFN